MAERIIAHLDMDAFFASVEERDRPWLKGLPIVVGADPLGGEGRGVVSTANYAARVYGIHSAMPIRTAWRLSEEARKRGLSPAAFIEPRFQKYEAASKIVMECIQKYSDIVKTTSVDEAYFDLTHLGSFLRARDACAQLKKKVRTLTKLTCSIGIGPNTMLAKLASEHKKPDGLTIVSKGKAEAFMTNLPIRAIPGVGKKTEETLVKRGVRTVGDARALSWEECVRILGSYGFDFYERVRGNAPDELSLRGEAQSIGEHETFFSDKKSFKEVIPVFEKMSRRILTKLQADGFSGFRTVVCTIRFSDFETFQRSVTSAQVLNTEKDIYVRALKLALPFFEKKGNPQAKRIRMVGLRIEKLAKKEEPAI